MFFCMGGIGQNWEIDFCAIDGAVIYKGGRFYDSLARSRGIFVDGVKDYLY